MGINFGQDRHNRTKMNKTIWIFFLLYIYIDPTNSVLLVCVLCMGVIGCIMYIEE